MTELVSRTADADANADARTKEIREFGVDYADPRYDLPWDKLKEQEVLLVDKVKKEFPKRGMYAVWINPRDPDSNIIRTYESMHFSEADDFPETDEDSTLMLALVDTRIGAERLVHGATIMGPSVNPLHTLGGIELGISNTTGFYTIDGLIKEGNFTAKEFYEYYANLGIDVNSCISVETNFRVGERAESFAGLDSTSLAYLTLFNFMTGKSGPRVVSTPPIRRSDSAYKDVAVFASINQPSINSFRRVGIKCEPLMGREDLVTPEAALGKEYIPVVIPVDEETRALFEGMNFRLPELIFARRANWHEPQYTFLEVPQDGRSA